MKQNPLRLEHLQDFIAAYSPDDRSARTESERFRRFAYDELVARDKANLDITWLRDDSLEDTDNLPPPEVIAHEIIEDLEAAHRIGLTSVWAGVIQDQAGGRPAAARVSPRRYPRVTGEADGA